MSLSARDGTKEAPFHQRSVCGSFLQDDLSGRQGNREGFWTISQSDSKVTVVNTVPFTKCARSHEAGDDKMDARLYSGSDSSSHPARRTASSQLPRVSTMATKSQRPKGRESSLSSLNAAIGEIDHAEKISNIPPAKAAFYSARNLLTMIRVGFLPVYLCRSLANVCRTRCQIK